jgi:hypothetical protein
LLYKELYIKLFYYIRNTADRYRQKKNPKDYLKNTEHTILEDSVLKICHQGGGQGAEFFPSLSSNVLEGRDILLCLQNNQELEGKGQHILSDINQLTKMKTYSSFQSSRDKQHEP